MFGIYSNKRLTESERAILHLNPDDYNWYMVILSQVFKEHRHFEVREDIEVPQNEGDDGVVLIFEGGNPVYFRTLNENLTAEDRDSIFRVCSFLEEKFDKPIDAYVLCKPGCDVSISKGGTNCKGNIRIFFSFICTNDGEEIINRLEAKLKSGEKLDVEDSFDHMLLPYVGYADKEVFDEKYAHYMGCINSHDCGG